MARLNRKVPSSIRVNLLDERFGQLLVLGYGGRRNGQTIWVCQCDCGHVGEYHAGNLRAGRSSKCVGCQLEALQRTKKNRSHGKSRTSTYRAWTGTRRYGRCKRWDQYENFLGDMGERPDGARLVRLNQNRPFSKSNAVWRTPADTDQHDVERTLKLLCDTGAIRKSQIPAQRERLASMTRQARYQLRRKVKNG